MKKSRSQIMAIVLACLNTLLIIPALFGVAASAFLLLVISDRQSTESFYVYALIFSVWVGSAIGIVQYIGYIWHSFRALARKKSLMLWISTIIYNVLLIVLNLAVVWAFIRDPSGDFNMLIYLAIHLVI